MPPENSNRIPSLKEGIVFGRRHPRPLIIHGKRGMSRVVEKIISGPFPSDRTEGPALLKTKQRPHGHGSGSVSQNLFGFHRMFHSPFDFRKNDVDKFNIRDHKSVEVPVCTHGFDDLFSIFIKAPVGRAEIPPACQTAVKAQPPEIDPFVSIRQGVQQAPHARPVVAHKTQKRTPIKIRIRSRCRVQRLFSLSESLDALCGSLNPAESPGARFQERIKRFPGNIDPIVKTATGPARDLFGHLTKIDTAGNLDFGGTEGPVIGVHGTWTIRKGPRKARRRHSKIRLFLP